MAILILVAGLVIWKIVRRRQSKEVQEDGDEVAEVAEAALDHLRKKQAGDVDTDTTKPKDGQP